MELTKKSLICTKIELADRVVEDGEGNTNGILHILW